MRNAEFAKNVKVPQPKRLWGALLVLLFSAPVLLWADGPSAVSFPRPVPSPEWQSVDFQHVPPLFPPETAAVFQTAEKPALFPELKPASSETIPTEEPRVLPVEMPSDTSAETLSTKRLPSEITAETAEKPHAAADSSRLASPAAAENTVSTEKSVFSLAYWTGPEKIQGSLVSILLLSAVSLVPAFLMMTTSFVRIFVVLSILRHGFGTQGIPGTQVLAALALFMTIFIMYPTWERTWQDGVVPYQEGRLTSEEALTAGIAPIRTFMVQQLERTGSTEEILLFWRSSSMPPDESRLAEYTADDVPLQVLLPAFMLSELKTAFLIGVQLLIPMLVIDLLVSSILVSMGMFMLPPTMVSLPFKLLLFVLADGWRLVVEMLLVSF